MRTAIVTDSASYLSAADIKKYNIFVVPITVIFGQQTYLENVEITSKEFYERMRTAPELPTTTQITLGQMQQMYDQLAADGYDAVISIHLSSGITSFITNLESYLPNITNIKVYPFDSLITAAGEANMALLAAKLIAEGKTPEEVIAQLKHLRDTTEVYFVVDNLSHLVRTGRLSNASRLVGNLLRIKPVLTFEDGKIVAI
ncbi:DegV family protein, partial [Enterococcus faecium]